MWIRFDKVLLTNAPRGRMAALHEHRQRRIRKKYQNAVIFIRPWMTADALPNIIQGLQRTACMTPKAWRRFCHLARKCGLDARMGD